MADMISALTPRRRSSGGSALDGYFDAQNSAMDSVDRFSAKRASNRAGQAMKSRDYTGAANEFYDAGLLGEGSEVQNYGQAQEDRASKLDAETVKKRGAFLVDLSRGLKNVPEAERNAQFERFAPALKSLGADDDLIGQLRQAPKDDASLDMFAGGVEKQLVEFIKSSDGSYTAADKETGLPLYQYQAPTPDKYEQVDPEKNLTLIPGSPGAGGGSASGSGQPRNMRNNNPGNIEDGDFAKSLPGYAGTDGRFAKFASPEAGTQAQTRLLASYGQRGFNTVAKIIGRWAPASDGNDVAGYARFVSQKLGVSPDQPLDLNNPQVAGAVAEAIKQFEGGPQTASNGRAPQVVAAAQPKAADTERRMTPEEVKAAGYQPGSVVMVNAKTGVETVKQGPGAGSGKITDGMRNVASFARDMLAANDEMNGLAKQGVFRPTAQVIISEKNGVTRLVARNPKDAAYVQAANAWLLPLLRKETGAAVTAPELAVYMDTYIPLPSDDDSVVLQKAASRRRKMINLMQQSRPAYEDQFGASPSEVITYGPKRKGGEKPAAKVASGAPAAPKVGQVIKGHRFKGGNPADPKSWAKV